MSAEKFLECIRFLIITFAVLVIIYYGTIYGKIFSYGFFYKAMVIETVQEVVKENCLK